MTLATLAKPIDALADALPEIFSHFGRIVLRRMFGGHGVYHEGLMFALVVEGRLFLKTDADAVAAFEARGLAPFSYVRNGRTVHLSYREAPPELFEDRDAAADWARRAYGAALRSGSKRTARISGRG